MCLEISDNLLLVLQDAPKCIFSSGQQKKTMQRHFFSTLHPLSTVIFATATVLAFVLLRNSRFNFHCYTQREATPTQKSARKCTETSRDFLRERLQSAFTLANQLRRIAQQHTVTFVIEGVGGNKIEAAKKAEIPGCKGSMYNSGLKEALGSQAQHAILRY